jgi:DnaJ family protein A protein 5
MQEEENEKETEEKKEEKEIEGEKEGKATVESRLESVTNGRSGGSSNTDSDETEAKQAQKERSRGKKAKRKGVAKRFVVESENEEGEEDELVSDLLKPASDLSDSESDWKAKKGKLKSKKKTSKGTKPDKNPMPEMKDKQESVDVVEQNSSKTDPEMSVNSCSDDPSNKEVSESLGSKKDVNIKGSRSDGTNTSPNGEEMLLCAKCQARFPSKNKLFSHLKSTGHALYLGDKKVQVAPQAPSLKGKKKGKK